MFGVKGTWGHRHNCQNGEFGWYYPEQKPTLLLGGEAIQMLKGQSAKVLANTEKDFI